MFLSRTITRSRWLRATVMRGHGFIAQSPVLAPVPSFILSSDHGTHSLDQTLYLVSGAQQRVRLQFAHRELTLYFTALPHPGPFSLSSFLLWPSHYTRPSSLPFHRSPVSKLTGQRATESPQGRNRGFQSEFGSRSGLVKPSANLQSQKRP